MKHSLSIMDSSGDRRTEWDESDPASMEAAKELFDSLRSSGGQVFRVQPGGEGGGIAKEFEPRADLIGVPRIIGG